MKKIEKKCWPEYFEAILSGKKKYELRLSDFEIDEGDILVLTKRVGFQDKGIYQQTD